MVCYSCSVPYLGKVKENNKKIEVDYAPIWIAGMILYMYHGALLCILCNTRTAGSACQSFTHQIWCSHGYRARSIILKCVLLSTSSSYAYKFLCNIFNNRQVTLINFCAIYSIIVVKFIDNLNIFDLSLWWQFESSGSGILGWKISHIMSELGKVDNGINKCNVLCL